VNLHQIVAGAVGAVNPLVPCDLRLSVGYTIMPDGSQAPQYAAFAGVLCQVQELTSRDLRQLDALNIQGSMRSIYLNGQWFGVVRVGARGGDLLTMADGTVWLVTAVLEIWPDWTKISVTLQDGS
jgi:hypothetical protein